MPVLDHGSVEVQIDGVRLIVEYDLLDNADGDLCINCGEIADLTWKQVTSVKYSETGEEVNGDLFWKAHELVDEEDDVIMCNHDCTDPEEVERRKRERDYYENL